MAAIMKSSAENPLYLGIDGGGSKCRATLVSADNLYLGSGVAGPANPFQNLAQTFDSITTATRLALEEAQLCVERDSERIVAGVGLAGVNLTEFYDVVCAWNHPFKRIYVTTDLHIACLGAHAGNDGAVIVVGTGTCGHAIVGGKHFSYGGHGFPLGDKGSGAWLGLEAVKAMLLAADQLGPATRLSQLIGEQIASDPAAVITKLAGASSSLYARLAPLVVRAAGEGDPVANGIMLEGAQYIASLADRLYDHRPPNLSLLGGLGQHLMPWLEQQLSRPLAPPALEPDLGAVYYARQQWAREQ